jgi:trans-aconitate methyltransferase
VPYSDGSLRPWLLEQIQRLPHSPRTVVDVGAGAGLNVDYFRPAMPGSRWTGIEVWEPYIEQFSLHQKYDSLIQADVRTLDLPEADLYVFGDVLEHMPAPDALALWSRARKVSHHLMASLPIVHYPQGAEHGNPFEEHHYHWGFNEFAGAFPGVGVAQAGVVVGAFWADGLLETARPSR